VVSADLSRATDLVSHAWNKPLLESLQIRLGLSKEWLTTAVMMMNAYQITYPDGKVVHRTTSGWLMGHPLTWALLCLLHKQIAVLAGLRVFKIRGDDLIGLGTDEAIGRYMDLMKLASFKVNEKKTFISRHGGIFAELAYVRRGDRIVPFHVGAIPRAGPTADLSSLESAWTTAELLPAAPRRRFVNALWSAYKGPLAAARREGIPITLPRILGGVGIPTRSGSIGKYIAGKEKIAKLILCGVTPLSSAWSDQSDYTVRSTMVTGFRNLTKDLHQKGELSRFTPLTEPWLNSRVQERKAEMVKFALDTFTPATLKSIGADWARARSLLKSVKAPPKPIGDQWDFARIRSNLVKSTMEGVYRPFNAALERPLPDPFNPGEDLYIGKRDLRIPPTVQFVKELVSATSARGGMASGE